MAYQRLSSCTKRQAMARSPAGDLHRDFQVGFAGIGLHAVGQAKIQKPLAGGVHDELAGLIAERLLGGTDNQELAASSRPPGGKPLFVIDKAVLS